jgi:pimeloyl-ACP methyl ester carboxylesterase
MGFRLDPIVEGNDAGETLFFVQGWPDDASLWDPQVAVLVDRYRCVRVTLPNHGGTRDARWGYGTDEIVEALATCVRGVSPDGPVTLILHDWGCLWGHLLHHRHPELVSRVAGLDVAPHYEPGFGAVLGILLYQGWLAIAFLLGGPVGDWMTRLLASAFGAPLPRRRITAWMNYPYRNIWRDILSGRARKLLDGYWPEVPLLFVYGEKKPFPFHSPKWVEHVERTGGRVVALAGGHWVSRHPTFNDVLLSWLEATGSAGRRAGSL